ncbi:MAG: AAC(3) family N-acetyltransferase, partial [Lentisphaeria bacterium]|nr:AAC(3) family N-acetyltransferase [Lentisphaeria bacterium]
MTTQRDIEQGLRELGLSQGDSVLLHSSLVSVGELDGGVDALINAFLAVIGDDGTLLAPCFAALGIVPETLKKRPGAIVSPCPVGTVVALGRDAEFFCCDHWVPDSPHAENTPYGRLAERGGFICLFGVDQDRNTFLHGIEARLKLPYLGEVSEKFTTPDGVVREKTWHYYPGPHRDFIGLDRQFAAAGVMRRRRIGNAEVRLMSAAEVLRTGLEIGAAHPDFVLCDNPACADCTGQRAALFSARLEGEAFKLSISSQLAGRYVDEIVETLGKLGIHYVELDNIQGRPAAKFGPDNLADVCSRLRRGGLAVSALRLPALPDAPEELWETTRKCSIDRLIVPLRSDAATADFIAAARSRHIDCLVANRGLTSTRAAADYLALGFSAPAFCFAPAEFAAVGMYALFEVIL